MWFLAGSVLATVEMLTGTFGFLVLAAGSFSVCLVLFAGVPLGEFGQAALFATVVGAGLWVIRGKLASLWRDPRPQGDDSGKTVLLLQDLGPGEHGRGRYQGTTWAVVNESRDTLTAQDTVEILRVDGNTLCLGPSSPTS